MSKIDVSYIIPCYNSNKTIVHCVEAITTQSGEFTKEIILVDSSSNPVLETVLEKYINKVKIIYSQTRLFPGEARNIGLKNTRGKYLALIDSDVILNREWTTSMINSYQQLSQKYDPHIVLGGSIENDPDTSNIWSDTLTIIEFSGVLHTSREGFRDGFPSTNLFLLADTNVMFDLSYSSHRMAEDVFFYKDAIKKGVRFYFIGQNKVRHMICKDFFKYTFYLGAAACIVRFGISNNLMKFLFALIIPIGSFYKFCTILLGLFRNNPRHILYLLRHLHTLILGLISLHLGMLTYPLTRKLWKKTLS